MAGESNHTFIPWPDESAIIEWESRFNAWLRRHPFMEVWGFNYQALLYERATGDERPCKN